MIGLYLRRRIVNSIVSGKKNLTYQGTTTALSQARYRLAAATIGNMALFGGGCYSSSIFLTTVDAYDSNLTRRTATSLGRKAGYLAAAANPVYAIFGGGQYGTATSDMSSNVYGYNEALTQTQASNLSTKADCLAGTNVGNYAILAGGMYSYKSSAMGQNFGVADVNAYDTSLTKKSASSLHANKSNLAAVNVGDYAILAGGGVSTSQTSTTTRFATAEAYNTSLTKTTCENMSAERYGACAAVAGNRAVVIGSNVSGAGKTSDTYDTSLTHGLGPVFSHDHSYYQGTSLEGYALFGLGGGLGNYGITVIDPSLTVIALESEGEIRSSGACTTLNKFALFGGGYKSSTNYANVDVYTFK